MGRQLLQALGIKIPFGGIQNDEVAFVLVTIFLTDFFIFAGFQTVKHILGFVVIQHVVAKFFFLLDGGVDGFHSCANVIDLGTGSLTSGIQFFG